MTIEKTKSITVEPPNNEVLVIDPMQEIVLRARSLNGRLNTASATLDDVSRVVFGNKERTVNDVVAQYPPRELPESAAVTRIAPSPTGFMHIGGIYTAMISERLAHQTDGVFILRIEDTDKKREVEGAQALIANSLQTYRIVPDEGGSLGSYGPYVQSERSDLYNIFLRDLIESGKAYICFNTPDELHALRERQQESGITPGYYGEWATWRDASPSKVMESLKAGIPFVVRLKSSGSPEGRILVSDSIKGSVEMPESFHDVVLRKADGLPTYHFAHAVDDHLMGTTFVIRGDEWLASTPLHIQLFQTLGWEPPVYAHISPISIIEDGSRRKLSKRKDPEADVRFYDKQGFPHEGVVEYLMTLANSNFEGWRRENPDSDISDFQFTIERLAQSRQGPLFDMNKLTDICKEVISRYDADTVFHLSTEWAEKHDPILHELLTKYSDYARAFFNIDRDRNVVRNVRKDISKWADLRGEIGFYFDEVFDEVEISPITVPEEDIPILVQGFLDQYDPSDDKDTWFGKIRALAANNGYALKRKDYKKSPKSYKGQLSDVANLIRIAVTGRSKSPDLFSVMQVMGPDRISERLSRYL